MEQRSIPLLGEKTIEQLKKTHVAVFGLGGVGSFAVEALVRQGVGCFSLIDYDIINESNLNRQLIALTSTVSKLKTKVTESRVLDINPNAVVKTYPIRITADNLDQIDLYSVDYVLDCMDDVAAKLAVIERAKQYDIEVISCMGTGNKLDPSLFVISDISKSSVCPLAKKMRLALRKKNIQHVKVLYSLEQPHPAGDFIASVSFVPSVAGLLLAREIILSVRRKTLQTKINLVLEGGGMKGVYTAGVLDFFLDEEITFDAVYGVSAGACCACSYLSKQKGRSYHSMTDYIGDPDYASKRSLTKTGNYFNKDFIYRRLPDELLPFDYKTAFENPCKLYATVTNVETGKAEYHLCLDYHKDIEYVCASSSLPLLSEIQTIDGKSYLDGGLSDAIPFQEAKKNASKCVVVLTKPAHYQSTKQNAVLLRAMKIKYHRYPNLLKTIENRHVAYNQSLSQIEHSKDAFVIRPSKDLVIDRLESDPVKLKALYDLGYQDASDLKEELMTFLKRSD